MTKIISTNKRDKRKSLGMFSDFVMSAVHSFVSGQ